MKNIFTFLLFSLIIGYACSGTSTKNETPMESKSKIEELAQAGYKYDSITTPAGRNVNLVFIKHGSIIFDIDGYLVYVDPVTIFGNDFSAVPKADMLLVTHEHHDHFDPKAIEELSTDSTRLIMSRRVTELYGKGDAMQPGDSIHVDDANFELSAVPAYNTTEGHLQFHPKEREDIGFVFDIDGLRIYVAGDTEVIPEMADLKDIDIAFLPVNQPYTMTPDQAIEATEIIRPKVLYPYHYGETDLGPLVEKFAGSDVDVRVRQLQ